MFLLLTTLAAAMDIDIALGPRLTQNEFYNGDVGPQLSGRFLFTGNIGIQAGVFVSLAPDSPSNLTNTLVGIAYEGDNETSFRQPVDREAASVEVLAVLSPLKRPTDEAVTVWATGLVGFSGLMV